MSKTAGRVAKNTMFLYGKMAITMFISLYTTRLVLNELGAADFGIFTIVGGAIGMLSFLNAAMAGATQRFMSFSEGTGDKDKQKNIFNISYVLHLSIAVIMAIVLLIAGWFFFNGLLNIAADRMYAAKVVYGSLIVSTVFSVMSVPYDAVLNAHENMLYFSIVGIVESFLKLGAALAVVYFAADKLVLYGILMACIPIITMAIMRVYCHKKYSECIIAPKRYWDKGLMNEMTRFAGWNFLGNMSGMVGNYGNGIVMNHFYGTIVNAALGVAGQINGQLMVFSNNIGKALNPVIVKKQGAGDQNSMMYFSLIGSKIAFFFLAIFAIPVLIETSFILKLWLTIVPDWTVIFVRLQLIKTLLELLTISLGTSLAAKGNIKGLSITSVIVYLLPLPLLIVLFKFHFPPYWMFIIGIFFMVVIGTGFKLYYCIKLCDLKLSDLYRTVFFPCIASFVVVLVSILFFNNWIEQGIFRLVLNFFVSISLYTLLIYLFSTGGEKALIKNLILQVREKFSYVFK